MGAEPFGVPAAARHSTPGAICGGLFTGTLDGLDGVDPAVLKSSPPALKADIARAASLGSGIPDVCERLAGHPTVGVDGGQLWDRARCAAADAADRARVMELGYQ
jgi:hypothetical protein